ncbi:MAG: Trk system potassium transporter TrkA [Candidatus Cloacimonadota bacterium]|nr:MAG: Trk system potassium transporter TrkA [Candidatus Cloacimonadota bacterium]PIE79112.1 MAG: Trk system potassium transporter TrkA [Candidatus Delongbacteria bacterium]
MNIIIFGAGKTGEYLARVFTSEGSDVTIVDKDGEKCRKIESAIDVTALEFDGIKKEFFNKDYFSNVDLFIAVTAVDELNITACTIAKKLGTGTTIARIRNEDYDQFKDLIDLSAEGIDLIIHPEKELTKELINLVSYPEALDIYNISKGELYILSTEIKKDSPFLGRSLKDISKDKNINLENYRVVFVEKGIETIIPKGRYVFEEKDKVYFISLKDHINQFFSTIGCDYKRGRDIMINGWGDVSKTLAVELERIGGFNVKLILNDRKKAEQLSEILTDTLVVVGEATDMDILATEGIIDMDFYLALTGNDEANMVSSLLASHLDVKRTITRIEETTYLPISKTIGLGRCINSSIATTNAIMRFFKHGKVVSSSTFKGINIDAITFKIDGDSKCIGKPISSLKFPGDTIIGAITRDDNFFIPAGNNEILPGDEIIVFTTRDLVPKIEKMFGN